ncbi:MAG: hypothetical protein WKF65_13510 [Gaiellaceae bacterium]
MHATLGVLAAASAVAEEAPRLDVNCALHRIASRNEALRCLE